MSRDHLINLIADISLRTSQMRSTHRILRTQRFFDYWMDAPEEQRGKIQELAINGDSEALRDLLREVPIRSLRYQAAARRIPNYSKMTRTELEDILQDVSGKTPTDT